MWVWLCPQKSKNISNDCLVLTVSKVQQKQSSWAPNIPACLNCSLINVHDFNKCLHYNKPRVRLKGNLDDFENVTEPNLLSEWTCAVHMKHIYSRTIYDQICNRDNFIICMCCNVLQSVLKYHVCYKSRVKWVSIKY
jgi:hypothetical protein